MEPGSRSASRGLRRGVGPTRSAGVPGPIRDCGPEAGMARTRRDTRNISLGLSRPLGTASSFIRSRFAERLVCARLGARRWGPAGDQVETAIWETFNTPVTYR